MSFCLYQKENILYVVKHKIPDFFKNSVKQNSVILFKQKVLTTENTNHLQLKEMKYYIKLNMNEGCRLLPTVSHVHTVKFISTLQKVIQKLPICSVKNILSLQRWFGVLALSRSHSRLRADYVKDAAVDLPL